MTNSTKYELTFWGAANVQKFPRYRRMHTEAASIEATIARVGHKINLNAHPPVIYCGSETVALNTIKARTA